MTNEKKENVGNEIRKIKWERTMGVFLVTTKITFIAVFRVSNVNTYEFQRSHSKRDCLL